MPDQMLKFTSRDAAAPKMRAAATRARDFEEAYKRFTARNAELQAGRCSQCGVPFCQSACPLHNNIPDWLLAGAEGRAREAYDISAATNPMPEVCGRICPQDRLCESSCVIEQSGHGAVTIGAVEKHLTDLAWKKGWVEPIRVGPASGASVGVIGAGPAGLAAAERLRGFGHGVTVYDRHDRAGGLLVYGIPSFKLEKEIVARRAERCAEAGITFALNVDVGVDVTVAELRAKHDAVLIAVGVYKARALKAPGAGAPSVLKALDYLISANRDVFGEPRADEALNAEGKRVVVVGGGDTAMDCVRTAVRQGAASVTCLYRRDRANMPGSAREVAAAEEEGVRFEWLAAPKAILTRNDEVKAVRAARMRLGPVDASGRQRPEEAPDGGFDLDADVVITALGFDPEDPQEMFQAPDLKVGRGGVVTVAPYGVLSRPATGAGLTSLDGVFAAGDVARGASLVVWALRDGMDAADQINAWIADRRAVEARAAE